MPAIELEVTRRHPECAVCRHPYAAHRITDEPECLLCGELETFAYHRYVA